MGYEEPAPTRIKRGLCEQNRRTEAAPAAHPGPPELPKALQLLRARDWAILLCCGGRRDDCCHLADHSVGFAEDVDFAVAAHGDADVGAAAPVGNALGIGFWLFLVRVAPPGGGSGRAG